MTYLGVDYGLARIGLAISESGVLSKPICIIQNKGDKKNIVAIKEVITKYCGSMSDIPLCIVVGLPLYKDGNESEMSCEARKFGELLARDLVSMVEYQNEYLSSSTATDIMRGKKGDKSIDAVAAAVILQNYLDNNGGKQ
ncbi:MAG: Holliday junction resolvase RuvX [Christensenellaceae bacterium]|nr:Holliday junction resolvase RuvX [Christensenellaceae bacterium]